jgi:hypothetical protein
MSRESGLAAAIPFHGRYLALVGEIERSFPVSQWKSGDVQIWPLARMDLYDDMYCANAGGYPPESLPRWFPMRALAGAATPLRNVWRSRRDLKHWLALPKRADAIFLGDGVSLDRVGYAWQDRYSEPIMAALERRGSSTFLMQSGELPRGLGSDDGAGIKAGG